MFTAYVEYLHLITNEFLPQLDNLTKIDNQDQPLLNDLYHGRTGPGSSIKPGITLTRAEPDRHPLISYLGATETQHTHIAAFFTPDSAARTAGQLENGVRFDPDAVLNHNRP